MDAAWVPDGRPCDLEMRRNFRGIALVVLAILFGLHGLKQPMALIVPMAVAAFILRERLAGAMSGISARSAFLGSGLAFGLSIEVFAILDNLGRPDEQKILMHPDPGLDLLFGVASYGMTLAAWWFLLARASYSTREVFVLTAIYGAWAEQSGAIIASALASPWPGIPLMVLIGSVYGTFPALAHMVVAQRLPVRRPPTAMAHRFLALAVLFAQWAAFGLLVLPGLKLLLSVRG